MPLAGGRAVRGGVLACWRCAVDGELLPIYEAVGAGKQLTSVV